MFSFSWAREDNEQKWQRVDGLTTQKFQLEKTLSN